ncbi:IPT/TIG domain protein [Andreesenia angusta]|uniref:IPT/TIG domain protein n=1 Tax=Andreesenia angusta TaxID=39480 RepID=A0A1S1V6U0_9FIRM|nr:IPT/TIG domain-containing protein [Andreesenia angusta]OHW61857.1 IPT/TIG domain protein [Andreesenia angusta]
MIKKKLLSLLLVFAMVMGMLPFGEISAYAANDPYVNNITVKRTVERNVDDKDKVTEEKIQVVELSGGNLDKLKEAKNVKVILHKGKDRKSGQLGIVNPPEVDETGTNMTLKLGSGQVIEPGEEFYPEITYEIDGDKKTSWDEDDPKKLIVGSIIDYISIANTGVQVEKGGELKFEFLLNTKKVAAESLKVYLKKENNLDPIFIGEIFASSSNNKIELTVNAEPSEYELIVSNDLYKDATSHSSYKFITVNPGPDDIKIHRIAPRLGSDKTDVIVAGENLYNGMKVAFGDKEATYKKGEKVTIQGKEYESIIVSPPEIADNEDKKVPIKVAGKHVTVEGESDKAYFFYADRREIVIDENLSDKEGRENTIVNLAIQGKHFQDILNNKSEETSIARTNDKSRLTFTREVEPSNTPSHWVATANKRERTLRVRVGSNSYGTFEIFNADGDPMDGAISENGTNAQTILNSLITNTPEVQKLNIKVRLPYRDEEPSPKLYLEVVDKYYNGSDLVLEDTSEASMDFTITSFQEPEISEVSVLEGPIASSGAESEKRVIAEISGNYFLVNNVGESKPIELPKVFLVPKGEYKKDDIIGLASQLYGLERSYADDNEDYENIESYVQAKGKEELKALLKYRGDIKEETVYNGISKIEDVPPNSSKDGDRIVVAFPSSEKTGERDIFVVNPDLGATKSDKTFIFKEKIENSRWPEIESITPERINFKGGTEVTIVGKKIPLEKSELILTVDGHRVKDADITYLANSENIEFQTLKFKAPGGSIGSKVVQIIRKSPSGDKCGLTSYNYQLDGVSVADETFEYIDDDSKPDLVGGIFPEEGGPGTPVYIHGEGFKQGSKVIIQGSRKGETIEITPGSDDIWQNGKIIYFEIPSLVEQNNQLKDKFTGDEAYMKTGPKSISVKSEGGAVSDKTYKFEYRNPPGVETVKIKEVNPSYTIKGTDINVTLTGENFKSGIIVLFGGRKAEVVSISGDGKKLVVKAPPYVTAEKVDVVVYNKDTGWDKLEDGFEYLESGETKPEITEIKNTATGDATGVLSGGETVSIKIGPFVKTDKLPQVYFGGSLAPYPEETEAIKTEWEKNKNDEYYTAILYVKTPAAKEAGSVDVIVTNPRDAAGIAVKEKGFTYKSSEPNITKVYESVIPKNGGREIYIEGTGFMKAKSSDYKSANPSKGEKVEMEIEVQFGAESKSEDIFGSGVTTLQMDNFKVDYYPSGKDGGDKNIEVIKTGEGFGAGASTSGNVSASITPGEPLYVSLRTSGTADISEGIKVEVDGDKLIATRQMAIKAAVNTEGTQITVKTPPMLKLGKDISLTVTNIDGGTASWKGLEVKNPASKPKIVDIDEDNKGAVKEGQEIIAYRVTSGVNGGKPFSIKVTDFADGAVVSIGGQKYEQGKGYEIASREGGSTVWLKITPVAAKPEDIGKQLPIMVTNPDGGSANSKADITVGNPKKPAYFFYQESDSNPVITSIEPNEGSTIGGEKVTITGSGFKYPDVEVTFGGVKAELDPDPGPGKEQSSTTLHVLAPPADSPGEVDVYVENTKEYGMSNSVKYTYKASPVIIKIVPNVVRSIGGEKVEIIGKGFEEGATVKIGEEELPAESVKFVDQFKIEILTPKVELPNGVDELKKDVTVTNPNGESDTEKDGITFIRPFPMKPTGFKATAKPGRTILLEWDERILDDDESKIRPRYRIEISDSKNGPFKHLGEVEDSISSYLVRDLEPNKKYYFRLWALNQYGQSQGFAEANTTTLKPEDDSQDGEFEDDTETESQVLESGGNITVNYSKKYTTEDYAHDFIAVKYTNYRTITLNIPAAVVNKSGNGILSLKHRDFEIKSALSTLKSGEREYKDGEILQVKITKLFGGEQSTALKYAPSGYTAQNQGVKIEYTVGSGANNTALENVKGMIFAVYVDKPLLSDIGHYSYKPGEMAAVREKSVYSRVYSDVHKKEVYKLDSNVKRSGYYMAFGK